VGPIVHQESALALVELFLGPTPQRGQTPLLRGKYVEWLEYLVGILCDGIERRFLAAGKPLQAALLSLDAAAEEAERHQGEIRKGLERTLHMLAGQNFGTLQANQELAGRVHQLLESKGLRVKCPECGAPAILRCQGTGNSRTGVFLFDHYLESGRTFHGGPTTFPCVTVIAKLPRRRRS
jgi:hypothetical protein